MFTLVHQHPDFLIINKHPEVSVHKDDNDQPLLAAVAELTGDKQLYLIHRLDKMTSGLLLLGRNKAAAALLSANFANRTVEKFYIAISTKKPKKKQGVVVGDMSRSRRSSWKLESSKENPAVTQFFSAAAGNGRRFFLCKPIQVKPTRSVSRYVVSVRALQGIRFMAVKKRIEVTFMLIRWLSRIKVIR